MGLSFYITIPKMFPNRSLWECSDLKTLSEQYLRWRKR